MRDGGFHCDDVEVSNLLLWFYTV